MPDDAGGRIPEGGTDLDRILALIPGLFPGSTTDNTNSPAALDASSQLLPLLMQMFTSGDFSVQAADKDSAGAVQSIINGMLQSGMPGISGSESISGGYNSTTAQLLRNDLATRAAEAGAARKDSTRLAYASQRNSQGGLIVQLINAMANAQRSRTTSTSATGNQAAAGTAALLAALKALTGGKGSGGGQAPKPSPGAGGGGSKPGAEPDTSGTGGSGAGGRESEEDARQNDPLYQSGGGTGNNPNSPAGDPFAEDPYEVDQFLGDNSVTRDDSNNDPYQIDQSRDDGGLFNNNGGGNPGDGFTDNFDFGDMGLGDFNFDLGDFSGGNNDFGNFGDFGGDGGFDFSFFDDFGGGGDTGGGYSIDEF